MLTLSGQNGGGQILRSTLSLSMMTGQPFRMTHIRGKRKKPGLMRQHLTCVQAAVEISQGSADGCEIGSCELIFHPGEVQAGDYHFAIGTAGSTTLLAQTLLPALWNAPGSSTLKLTGGTHNPLAPPADFIQRTYLPALAQMGLDIEFELHRFGFVPAGGGEISFSLPGSQTPQPSNWLERGEELSRVIHCLACHLPEHVPTRESSALRQKLGWTEQTVSIQETDNADCAGNVLAAEIQYEHITERVSAFGAHGKPSVRVAQEVTKQISNYLQSNAVVGRQLADQLLLPLALAGGGSFLTLSPSNHLLTNAAVIEQFLSIRIGLQKTESGPTLVEMLP